MLFESSILGHTVLHSLEYALSWIWWWRWRWQ